MVHCGSYQWHTSSLKWFKVADLHEQNSSPKRSPTSQQPFLVGGWTNPFEKYDRQNGNLPQIWVKIKKKWNHHLVLVERFLFFTIPKKGHQQRTKNCQNANSTFQGARYDIWVNEFCLFPFGGICFLVSWRVYLNKKKSAHQKTRRHPAGPSTEFPTFELPSLKLT